MVWLAIGDWETLGMEDKFASYVVNHKNTAVSDDLGTVKFQLQTAVEIDP